MLQELVQAKLVTNEGTQLMEKQQNMKLGISSHDFIFWKYFDLIMKEYEQTVSEEDAYEAKYKTGYETPVRTNSGERKPTNLVAFFFFRLVYCYRSWLFLKNLVPSFFFKTGHQLPPVWGTLWITSCKQEVSSFHRGCSTRHMANPQEIRYLQQMGGCD